MLAREYDAFLVDLDGVLFAGDRVLPGAREGIDRLQSRGTPVRVVTNSSSSTREELHAKLTRAGIDVPAGDIVSAASATADHLRTEGIRRVHLVGNESLEAELRRRAVTPVEDGDADAPEAVVVGLDETVMYTDIKRATRLLHATDRPFVAANADPSYPVGDGIAPGTGSILAAIETAAGREATVVGKPEPRLFELAMEGLGDARVAMVGDTRGSDIEGAHRAGIAGVLVTGHRTAADDAGGPTPEHTIETLAGLFGE